MYNLLNVVLQKQAVEKNFSERVLFTDEAHFTRGGIFNTHNFNHWAANNPHGNHHYSHQYRFSVNVWAGIVNTNLIGRVLDISGRCSAWVVGGRSFIYLRTMWYQYGEAPAHYHANANQLLD